MSGSNAKILFIRKLQRGSSEPPCEPVVSQGTQKVAQGREPATTPVSQFSTPAACGWCGSALAPYLIAVGGRDALLCPSCHRWTYPDGAA